MNARVLQLALVALCACVVGLYLLLALYSFPQVDDFDEAFWVNAMGVLGTVAYAWREFSGRFSQMFVCSLIDGAGVFPSYTNLMVVALMALFAFSLAFFTARLGKMRLRPWLLADVAFVFLALPFYTKSEAFYGQAFNILYLLPLSLTLVALALAGKGAGRFSDALWLAAAVFIGGFSEAHALLLVGALGCYAVLNASDRKEPYYRHLVILLIGAALAFAINLMAPGNYKRLGEPASIAQALGTTCLYMVTFLPVWLVQFSAYAFARASFAPLPGPRMPDVRKASFWLAVVLAAACFGCFFIVIYGYGGKGLPSRAFLLPFVFCFMAVLALASWLGQLHPVLRRKKLLPLWLLILAFPAASGMEDVARSLTQAPGQREAAFAQIEAAVAAKAAGKAGAVLPVMPNEHSLLYVNTASPDPESWRNGPYERYFGLKKLSAPDAP